MLAFTPQVNEVLRWFQATHRQEFGGGVTRWVLVQQPHGGAAGDQDARLMAALEHVRVVMNDLARDGTDDVAAREELEAFREAHSRNRR